MARAQKTDYLSSMRFFVDISNAQGGSVSLGTTATGSTGFQTCSTPEVAVEAVQYKEGTWIYPKKFPGMPSMSDVSLSRGVTRGDSSFWIWLKQIIEGSGEYRVDMAIKHYHRDNTLVGTSSGNSNLTNLDIVNGKPARIYNLKEAFAIRHKVASDLDSSSSEIAIMELDVTYEYFSIEEGATPGT
jgi:phage tail-like protein